MDADEMTLRGNILALGRSRPRIGNTVWIAPGAVVIGNVTIGDNSSVWFNCVLRGDTNAISIGQRALARQPTSTKGTAMATFLRIAIVAAAVAIQQPSASAAEFPSRSITIVVPYTAGGPTDIVGRLIAVSMSQTLKTPVLIENVGGAGGTRGAGQVARAAPDGHTLLLHNIGQATSATIYRKLPYNVRQSFQTVGLITDVPMTLIGRTGLKANSLSELLVLLRENEAKLNFGHAGIGSAAHLCGLLLASVANVQLANIPYQGSSQSLRDLVAGQIDIGCDQTTNTTPQIASGQIKAFAVTTPTRLKSLPSVPTASEAGLKGLEISVWHGLYAPSSTPEYALDQLNKALKRALKDPHVIARLADLGTEPVAEERASREVHRAFLASEVARWKPIIEAAGAFVE